jgi:hypothetical protein
MSVTKADLMKTEEKLGLQI